MNGKRKGGSFERSICVQLSQWVSQGKRTDLFWRSAMSGGRATVAHRKGESVRQAGDITAVAPEGHVLTGQYYVECKHYRDLDLVGFFLNDKGKLAGFWRTAKREAEKHGRMPMLIAKQNNVPTIMILMARDFSGPSVDLIDQTRARVYKFDEVLKLNKRVWKL